MGLFDVFSKKKKNVAQNTVKSLIENDGMDIAAKSFAMIIIKRTIPNKEIATQFILEELEGMSLGDEMAKQYALTSGFNKNEFQGALKNSIEEVDGPAGPQQLLLSLSMALYPDRKLMSEFRVKVDDTIMQQWQLGKYASINEI